jgi:DNA-binding XRE family transcriptional regulator
MAKWDGKALIIRFGRKTFRCQREAWQPDQYRHYHLDGISLERYIRDWRMNAMAKNWKDIRRTHSPEVEAEIARRVREAAGVMTLYQLREARSLTQVNLAKVLNINQGAVSKMEKRTDMYVSTLRNFIQAMGGQLQVKAIFPEGEIQIDQFENVAESQDVPLATV